MDTVEKISKLPGLEVEGIFTHFARADEKTIEPAREPFRKYMAFVEELEKRGVKIPIHHVSNSASIIGFSEANLDMVRSGITTYGLYPSNEVAKDVLVLEPAMQWKSIISRAGNEYQLRWYIYGEGKNDGRYNSGWLC